MALRQTCKMSVDGQPSYPKRLTEHVVIEGFNLIVAAC